MRLYSIIHAFFQLSDWDKRPSVGRLHVSGKEPISHLVGMVVVGTGMEMVAGATSNGGGTVDDADATTTSSITLCSTALGGSHNVTLQSISPAICGRACSRANRPCLRAARLTRCPHNCPQARRNRRQFLWHWVTKLRWHFQGVEVQRPRQHWCQCQQQQRLPTRIWLVLKSDDRSSGRSSLHGSILNFG